MTLQTNAIFTFIAVAAGLAVLFPLLARLLGGNRDRLWAPQLYVAAAG